MNTVIDTGFEMKILNILLLMTVFLCILCTVMHVMKQERYYISIEFTDFLGNMIKFLNLVCIISLNLSLVYGLMMLVRYGIYLLYFYSQ